MEKRESNLTAWREGLTQEERKEQARKAGKASGAARRKNRTFRAALSELLRVDVDDDETRAALIDKGVDPSIINAVAWAQLIKAQAGDTESARFVRDSIGEKPTEALQMAVNAGPVKARDLATLTDAELEALADQDGD